MSDLPDWEDPRVQIVYELLCADLVPPGDDHWEGWVARHIVAALDQKEKHDTTPYNICRRVFFGQISSHRCLRGLG